MNCLEQSIGHIGKCLGRDIQRCTYIYDELCIHTILCVLECVSTYVYGLSLVCVFHVC